MNPESILAGLNREQRDAATATSGPVVILAGAGTGKTRVIAHRVAYAVATGVVDPKRVLVVTFTDKAATEMKQRLARLGLPQVAASTFHSAAKRQLEYHWPRVYNRPLPKVLSSKLGIVAPLARQLPGGYKFTPAKDLADEIEWAKNRRIGPETYPRETSNADRETPIPAELVQRIYRQYEHAKERAGAIDFEDMLARTVELYETDDDAVALVRARYTWFCVDEYQDTNRLQEDLLQLWLGDRRELCVVGDADQTIYSFTGANADYLNTFADRYPGARIIQLSENYRSTPQILALANRLVPSKQLRATVAAGSEAHLTSHSDGDQELSAIVTRIHAQIRDGVPPTEVAVLVRTNAQLVPFEGALTAAGIAFTVRGQRFFARAEVRAARQALGRSAADGRLTEVLQERWRIALGFDESTPAGPGQEARDQHASMLTLLAIAKRLQDDDSRVSVQDYLADLNRRDADEAAAVGEGVVLSTYHRAKGLEWDVVYLPMLEEGTLPIRQGLDDPAAVDEERRLLYVGITRARQDLNLSWAAQRTNPRGQTARARPSRFIAQLRTSRDLGPPAPGALQRRTATGDSGETSLLPGDRVRHTERGEGVVTAVGGAHVSVRFDSGVLGSVQMSSLTRQGDTEDRAIQTSESLSGPAQPLQKDLRAWRLERARADGVPAFVVAHNTLLEALAAGRPSTLQELLRIPGIGPKRVESYGMEILAIIQASSRGTIEH